MVVYSGVLDVEEFMEYVREKFPEPMKFHFTYDILRGIINYFMEQDLSVVQIANLLMKIVPEIVADEVLRFSKKAQPSDD